jgi:hypothetical protein
VLFALLMAVPAAVYAANLNEFISALSPTQNAGITVGAAVPAFQITSTCKGMGLQGYISKSPSVDGDGSFLAGDVQDQFPMPESAAFGSGIYEGTPQGTWLQQPGQYYWQARAQAPCSGEPPLAFASQPVYIQVLPGTTSSGTTDITQQENGDLLTIAQARAAIAPAVLKAKRKSARGLKRTCTRRSSGSILAVVCSASWTDNKKYRYNGLWRMALNDDGSISATFSGRRALSSCVKKRQAKRTSVKGCYKKHTFTANVE